MLNDQEEKLLQSIEVGSENDPSKPEFPPIKPHFPATKTRKIDVPGFSNVWLKDESVNFFSGTHKDRLAWEVVVIYRHILLAKKRGQFSGDLPQFSIISSGSAALAIARTLKYFGLPKIKVLVDENISKEILNALRVDHCEIYFTDLNKKELNSKEILSLTDNLNGFDLTSNKGIALEIGNYDWFSFEALNESPDYVFLPFGTGTIYKKILEVAKNIISHPHLDRRYSGDMEKLFNCNYIGATTHDAKSPADKLYSHFLPFSQIDNDYVGFYKTAGFCGPETKVYDITNESLADAMALASEQGIICEPSGISGLAILLQIKSTIPKDKKILVINTGKLKLENPVNTENK